MKPIQRNLSVALALSAALAACVPAPQPLPQPKPTPTPAPAPPPPAPVAQPSFSNWMDAPRTAGDWHYRSLPGGGIAVYGDSDSAGVFTLRCDRAANAVVLLRAGLLSGPASMTIRTETQTRTLAAQPSPGTVPMVDARLSSNDRLLDAMALSKGRFAVDVPGLNPLYLPSWAEVTRVIEDCR
ncbi:MAG: hypothetical protein ABGW87_06160 [Sphingomonadaceae bacterium]